MFLAKVHCFGLTFDSADQIGTLVRQVVNHLGINKADAEQHSLCLTAGDMQIHETTNTELYIQVAKHTKQ